MARPRQIKQTPEIESEPADLVESPAIKPSTKTVEALHTIKYSEPMIVPVAEPEEPEIVGDDDELEGDDTEERPKQPSFRTKLKNKLDKAKIGGSDQLKLRIDRLPYYEVNGQTGLRAEKEFMAIINCMEDFILTDEYLAEAAKRFGPGTYWFTLRHRNTVVSSWHDRVGGPPVQSPSATPVENGSSPPATFAPYPNVSTNPYPPRSVKQELREAVDMVKMIEDLRGGPQPEPQPAPQLSEEAQLASLLLTDSDVKKKALKKLLGSDGGETDYMALAIEHGPAILEAAGAMLTGVIQSTIEGIKVVRAQTAPPNIPPRRRPPIPQAEPAAISRTAQTSESEPAEQQPAEVPPEDQLLALVIDHCVRRIPPTVAANRVMHFADEVNDKAPVLSVDGYLEMFVEAPPEMIIEYVKTLPNGEQIAALPHALPWTTELQQLLKAKLETEEETDADDQ